MISNRNVLSLASAYYDITNYINKSLTITTNEEKFLESVRYCLDCIKTQKRNIVTDGIFSAKYNHLTQESIIENIYFNQQELLNYTWFKIKNLLLAIKSAKEKSKHDAYIKLLEFIEQCFQQTLETIQDSIYIENDITKIDVSTERETYSLNNQIIKLIDELNGRYLPYNQSLDPMRGREVIEKKISDFSGFCYGLTMSWGKEIKQFGHVTLLPRIDEMVFDKQKMLQILPFSKWQKDFFSYTDFRYLIIDMLNHMRPTKVYSLNWFIGIGESGHSTGIRLFPKQDGVEFFDPNFGIVIFDNKPQFVKWFSEYLCNHNFDMLIVKNKVKGNFSLQELGDQPASATPSIPSLMRSAPNNKITHNPERKRFTTLEQKAKTLNIDLENDGFIKRKSLDILSTALTILFIISFALIIFPPTSPSVFLTILGLGIFGGIIVGALRSIPSCLETKTELKDSNTLDPPAHLSRSTTNIMKITHQLAPTKAPVAVNECVIAPERSEKTAESIPENEIKSNINFANRQ